MVGGTALPREDYEQFLQIYVDNADLTGVTEDTATGTVAGDAGRAPLTELVLTMATKQFLALNGETITTRSGPTALADLEDGNPVLDAPKEVQDMLVDGQLAQVATAELAAPDAATLEARYTESPASTGALCARHILVATEAEADAVRRRAGRRRRLRGAGRRALHRPDGRRHRWRAGRAGRLRVLRRCRR